MHRLISAWHWRPTLVALALAAAGLTSAAAQEATPEPDPSFDAASPSPGALSSPPSAGIEFRRTAERDPGLVVPDADVRSLVVSDTAFALDLYRELTDETSDLVLGPLSISTAMAMQHVGASGDTATQIEQAMRFDLPPDRLDPAFDTLDRSLEALAGPGLELSRVNQLFGQAGFSFERQFLETLDAHYGAPLATVDYQADPEAARAVINGWVADQTSGRITDLIPEGKLHELTRLVLVNATSLDATWANQFNAAVTERRRFQLPSGRRVRVPTMSDLSDRRVSRGEGYRAVELAYVGDRLTMLIVVPDDLGDLERTLTPRRLDRIVQGLESEYVLLTLPTFSARRAVDLVAPLQALGIEDAFDARTADLSGVGAEPGLHIDSVVHEAFIRVAEAGTEAGAATAIGDVGVQGHTTFRVDRPFLWLIRDRETGSILFMGRITDPRETTD